MGGDDRHLERGAVRAGHRDPHRRVHRPRRPRPLEHRRLRPAGGVAGRASWRPETPSGAGSSETCTTAPSSASSRSRWRCGWPGTRLEADPAAANALLEAASEELATALEELRELARGIHPAILTDRGLAPALEALAGRSPVPVAITSLPEDRLPPQVEAAAYYVVSESLANVAKYAGASRVDVAVVCRDGWAFVEVADDGAGGADPARGSGLLGLADRVEALVGEPRRREPGGRRDTRARPHPARIAAPPGRSASRTADASPPHRAGRDGAGTMRPCLYSPSRGAVMPRKNLAARMGGWSAHHRWLALGLWFAFVIAAIVGGAITGQVNLKESQLGDGEAGHAARVIDDAGFKDRAGEMILITYPGHTIGDPGFRAVVNQAVDRVSTFPQVTNVRSPLASEQLRPGDQGRRIGARAVRHHGRRSTRPRTASSRS